MDYTQRMIATISSSCIARCTATAAVEELRRSWIGDTRLDFDRIGTGRLKQRVYPLVAVSIDVVELAVAGR